MPYTTLFRSNGVSRIGDIDSADLAEMVGSGFVATTDPTCIGDSDVVVICVPTPLDDDGTPDLSAVKAAEIGRAHV